MQVQLIRHIADIAEVELTDHRVQIGVSRNADTVGDRTPALVSLNRVLEGPAVSGVAVVVLTALHTAGVPPKVAWVG